jgi:hypothetical protein
MRRKDKRNKHKQVSLTVAGLTITKMLVLVFFGVIVYIGVIFCVDTDTNPIQLYQNLISDNIMRTVSINSIDNNITINIASICSLATVPEQPGCIVSQLGVYNYVPNNDTIRTPDEFVANGGVCRDLAVTYASIFERLDWKVYYDFTVPKHVFVRVVKEYNGGNNTIRCDLDGLTYKCNVYNADEVK